MNTNRIAISIAATVAGSVLAMYVYDRYVKPMAIAGRNDTAQPPAEEKDWSLWGFLD
jgi:hypothetical protein